MWGVVWKFKRDSKWRVGVLRKTKREAMSSARDRAANTGRTMYVVKGLKKAQYMIKYMGGEEPTDFVEVFAGSGADESD